MYIYKSKAANYIQHNSFGLGGISVFPPIMLYGSLVVEEFVPFYLSFILFILLYRYLKISYEFIAHSLIIVCQSFVTMQNSAYHSRAQWCPNVLPIIDASSTATGCGTNEPKRHCYQYIANNRQSHQLVINQHLSLKETVNAHDRIFWETQMDSIGNYYRDQQC